MRVVPPRQRSTLVTLGLLWALFYGSFTLFRPPLLDDADSVHVEVAREMLLRHDPVTLYANGIRYLEKAPLLYWLMALSMRFGMLAGCHRPELLAAAARIPLALSVLGMALLVEAFARRMFCSARAGLYAGLILLSSFGIFIFSRITIPDALVCLWIACSLYCFWRTEEARSDAALDPTARQRSVRLFCWGFAASSALNVLTKGLIGVVFPAGVVLLYVLMTRGGRRGVAYLRELPLLSALAIFFLSAAPWHIAAGLANPSQGQPAPFRLVLSQSSVLPWGHWQVPLPTEGNVRGWWWFYFMNEHLLRYLNLRVPRDYDTVPLVLFWGLCLIWLLPWSAFALEVAGWAAPLRSARWRSQFRRHDLPPERRARLLLLLWGAFVLLFFSLSTRQEYYILPALPAAAILTGGWLARRAVKCSPERLPFQAEQRVSAVLACFGLLAALACAGLAAYARKPLPGQDLAQLLRQNPGDYAMSFGHFLDLNAQAMGAFRLPLALTAASFGIGLPVAWWLRTRRKRHEANLVLAASTFAFLLAAHLGLQIFAPVLSSAHLAEAIQPLVGDDDLIVIHGEYEAGSTLGFYLRRPFRYRAGRAVGPLHILEGRSSNLWYGSFFLDAPPIFETPASLAAQWRGPRRIFLWQSVTDPPDSLPPLPGPVYLLVRSGGKEIVSNRQR